MGAIVIAMTVDGQNHDIRTGVGGRDSASIAREIQSSTRAAALGCLAFVLTYVGLVGSVVYACSVVHTPVPDDESVMSVESLLCLLAASVLPGGWVASMVGSWSRRRDQLVVRPSSF